MIGKFFYLEGKELSIDDWIKIAQKIDDAVRYELSEKEELRWNSYNTIGQYASKTETRVTLVEAEVNDLKKEIKFINEKLEWLMKAINSK